jgi:hypothetical protein
MSNPGENVTRRGLAPYIRYPLEIASRWLVLVICLPLVCHVFVFSIDGLILGSQVHGLSLHGFDDVIGAAFLATLIMAGPNIVLSLIVIPADVSINAISKRHRFRWMASSTLFMAFFYSSTVTLPSGLMTYGCVSGVIGVAVLKLSADIGIGFITHTPPR